MSRAQWYALYRAARYALRTMGYAAACEYIDGLSHNKMMILVKLAVL